MNYRFLYITTNYYSSSLCPYTGPQEVCNMETFSAECSDPDAVLVVQWARYGRMHTGRCVKNDYGYLGCESDVLPQVDRLCSGRAACSFKVADHLHGMQECPTELAPFLEIQYQCWPGGSQTYRDYVTNRIS